MEAFGYFSAILFFLAYLPQLWRTYKLRTVDDISLWMWVLTLCAYLTGLVYGIWLQKDPLILSYLLGLNCTLMMLLMYSRYCDPRKDHARYLAKQALRDMKQYFDERRDDYD